MTSDITPPSLLQQYLQALRSRGAELARVDDLGHDDQPVYKVAGLGYLLISLTAELPGLWQLDHHLTEQIKARAETEAVASWWALLIKRRDGRGANGYILSDFDSTPVKRPIEIEAGQRVIREKRHLDSLRLILSTDKQADLLLRQRR